MRRNEAGTLLDFLEGVSVFALAFLTFGGVGVGCAALLLRLWNFLTGS